MNPIERLMRLMTHFNIAATLATAAWVLWSGSQIVAGTSDWPLATLARTTADSQMAHGAASWPPARGATTDATARCHGAGEPAAKPTQAPGLRAGWQDT